MPTATNNSLKFLAQAFSVASPGEATGIYATKLGLFFKRKGASSIKVFLMEMKDGLPDRNSIVPGTTVTLETGSINVSNTGVTETTFEFDVPVFLDSSKQYCFAIQTPSSDFAVWGATQGERDLITNTVVNSNPLLEKAFYSDTDSTYAELVNQDIKFVLYRAKFNVDTSGTVTLRNKENLEYLVIKDINRIQSLIPYTSDFIGAFGETYSEKGKFVGMFRFEDTTSEKYVLLVDTAAGQTFNVNDQIQIYRQMVVDGQTQNIRLLNGTVESIKNYEYHSIIPRLNVDKKPTTELTLQLSGTYFEGSNFTEDPNYFNISDSQEKTFADKSRYLLSYSNEANGSILAGNSSLQVQAILNATNEYVAPIIKLDGSQMLLVTNMVNSNTTNETTRDGAAESKYVSRVVGLADGQDAEDIKVYVDAYKPKNTGVVVYGKFQASEDFTDFDNLPWIELTQVTPAGVYSDPKNLNDFREFEFQIPDEYKNNEGYFSYTAAAPATGDFVRFKKYSIKIVLTADAGYEYNPPRITDLRVIALQK
jgi:hypothetical protein